MCLDLSAASQTGTDFREGASIAVNASTNLRLLSRLIRRWVCRETVCKDHSMKKYICVLLVVSGALLSPQGEGWKVSNNSLNVTINVSGK